VNITVFVPGLFTSFAEISLPDIDRQACPSIVRILSKASRHAIPPVDAEHWLYQQFTGGKESTNIPVAAITALQDGLDSHEGYWMRADPVYLYPDTHSLVLQDPEQLKLSTDEVRSITEMITPLFGDYDAQLITPHTRRWYLYFEDGEPEISCTPLHEALSKPVNRFLPEGREKRRWHTLFNEIQMLLNQSEINRQREVRRMPPVNSLWFWGEGRLPDDLESPCDLCIGNDDLLKGLCLATDTDYEELSHNALENVSVSQSALVFDGRLQHATRLSRPELWLHALQAIEEETIAPLLKGLEQGRYKILTLLDAGHSYQCGRPQLKAFWKPVRKLSQLFPD